MPYPRPFVDAATVALAEAFKLETEIDYGLIREGRAEVLVDHIEQTLHELGHIATLPQRGRDEFLSGKWKSLDNVLKRHRKADDEGEVNANAVAILAAKDLLEDPAEFEDLRDLAMDNAPMNLMATHWQEVRRTIEKAMGLKANHTRAEWVVGLYDNLAGAC